MQWVLSTILGLIIAWIILAFVGPKPRVSYYVQAPVQAAPLSDTEKIMEAVGLKPSSSPAPASVAEVAIMEEMAPAPSPSPSVADMASTPAPDASNEVSPPSGLFGLNTPATPQPAAPAPGPAPQFQ